VISKIEHWLGLSGRPAAEARRELLTVGDAPRPGSVAIAVTDRCNLRCPTCSKWTTETPPRELDVPEWADVFAQLRDWLGPITYTVSGGEPALRRDLVDIVQAATDADLATNLLTNGTMCHPGRWEALAAAGVRSIGVSMNALTPELHNRSRGHARSHELILRFVEVWKRLSRRPPLIVIAIVYPANAHEMAPLARWAASQGASFLLQPLVPFELASAFGARLPGFTTKRFEWSFFEKGYAEMWEGGADAVHRGIDDVLRARAEGVPVQNPETQLEQIRRYFTDRADLSPCGVSWKNIEVDPYGYVRICFALDAIGHLSEGPIRSIWTGGLARERRREVSVCDQPCRLLNCNRD
jgi:MoaA/NifB/PqqE/SkfB family radical SAM enzyme